MTISIGFNHRRNPSSRTNQATDKPKVCGKPIKVNQRGGKDERRGISGHSAQIAVGAEVVKPGLGRYPSTVTVTINGEPREVAPNLDLQQLIDELGLGQRKIAVELNREIVRSGQWGTTQLAENDILEIVHFVGGG